MTDDQKAPYLEKYKKDHTTYEKSLLKWEDQMRKLVRCQKSVLLPAIFI